MASPTLYRTLFPLLTNSSHLLSNRYVGLNTNTTELWPYLPDNLAAPDWETSTPNWIQMFLLYVTLLSNFVPLSMYVTVEALNFFFLWLIYVDRDMYDATTNTRGLARSTNVTDLGQIQYIFSDKTGTLTQNVMRFKRCSVDGMVFGAPVEKSRPDAAKDETDNNKTSFHPTRQLLVGRVKVNGSSVVGTRNTPVPSDGLDGLEPYSDGGGNGIEVAPSDDRLTFNAEMFLRVMSLCHTVVVEKDLDMKEGIDATKSVNSNNSSHSRKLKLGKKLFASRNRTASQDSTGSSIMAPPLPAVDEGGGVVVQFDNLPSGRAASMGSLGKGMEKNKDGAPAGFAYQAESPDEGALVESASNSFGFQVIGRDSNGIKLRCAHPSVLSDERIAAGLKSGQISPKTLAAETAANLEPVSGSSSHISDLISDPALQRTETWSILAVNKFDSDRKRMSILLRSPPELGNIPMLLCKGADSAMLDPSVCAGSKMLLPDGDDSADLVVPMTHDVVSEHMDSEQNEWEMAQLLGIQSHLGDFATEGLRTLVLGVRFLTEDECSQWLEDHKIASTSIKNRDEKLTAVAMAIERNLHVVGATAIEDKLQVGVPKTIATLAKAGIKLWVLTGDKRETAVEIGYSTHVLTPTMHLTEVADNGMEHVRAQCAMEFMRLVKAGKLTKYQRSEVDKPVDGYTKENNLYAMGKFRRRMSRSVRRFIISIRTMFRKLVGWSLSSLEASSQLIEEEEVAEQSRLKDIDRRRMVRDRAEKILQEYLASPEGQKHRRVKQAAAQSPTGEEDGSAELSSDEVPTVFSRAQSAKDLIEKNKNQGRLSSTEKRTLSLAQLTAQQMDDEDEPLIDEDTLSLSSFFPTNNEGTDFDRMRRTLLERMFAVDRAVRKGRLIKHLKKEKRVEALASLVAPISKEAVPHISSSGEGPRALVIEGAALKHLLGDPELEELIFAIASSCEAVIACRVSPRQKALLVKLVRQLVVPEPVTLAIGDGANDVGMIQEAHVGIGISGKEGQQAVNASDFAIAQFRFLEDLVLIHGRWNFMRMCTVVLFSFYKNALMAGCLIVYNGETVYSGTPLFDDWVIAMLNFVAGFPIVILGLFDRCLDKEYIRKNPEVYQPTRNNELLTVRVLIRWVILTFTHIFVIYYCTIPQLSTGGGMTSFPYGLGKKIESDQLGEGEGGDLQSVGTIAFTNIVMILAYKVRVPFCNFSWFCRAENFEFTRTFFFSVF
jgi:magnesium-transporting ATPase (P-type)